MSDYEYDDEEEYTYEEDGEYDDGNEDASDDDKEHILENRRESAGSTKSYHSPEKNVGADRVITVPSDSFNILDCVSIEPIMRSLIEDVASLLDLNVDVTQSLLQHHRWDREKLIDAFFANPEKVMLAAGLDLYTDTVLEKLNHDCLSCADGKMFRSSSKPGTIKTS